MVQASFVPELALAASGQARKPTSKRNAELCALYQAGNDIALEEVLLSNIRLVFGPARSYALRWGLEFENLVMEGILGLMEAAKKFDPEKGAFSTIACWEIRRAIQKSIPVEERVVQVPPAYYRFLPLIKDAMKRLGIDQVRTEQELEKVAKEASHPRLSEKCIGLILDGFATTASLKIPKAEDALSNPEQFLAVVSSLQEQAQGFSVDDRLHAIQEIAMLLTRLWLLTSIPQRNKQLFRLRYGLYQQVKPLSFEAAAKLVGISRSTAQKAINERIWPCLKALPTSETTLLVHEESEASLSSLLRLPVIRVVRNGYVALATEFFRPKWSEDYELSQQLSEALEAELALLFIEVKSGCAEGSTLNRILELTKALASL